MRLGEGSLGVQIDPATELNVAPEACLEYREVRDLSERRARREC